jgi:hypothetical protein
LVQMVQPVLVDQQGQKSLWHLCHLVIHLVQKVLKVQIHLCHPLDQMDHWALLDLEVLVDLLLHFLLLVLRVL